MLFNPLNLLLATLRNFAIEQLKSDPPIHFSPETFKWNQDSFKIKCLIDNFLNKIKKIKLSNKNSFLIVVTPWMGTPVPWYAIIIGILLRANGHKITFVIDDIFIGINHSNFFNFQVKSIDWVLSPFTNYFQLIRLHNINGSMEVSSDDIELIDGLANLNAVWEFKGELNQVGKNEFIRTFSEQLTVRINKINTVLNNDDYNATIIPGGIWGSSGIWLKKAKNAGIRVVTYDSGGYGSTMLSVDGIACQLQDIPKAFYKIKTKGIGARDWEIIERLSKSEIQKRKAGVDIFSSQMKDTINNNNPVYKNGILIALNSAWDSAALGLHNIYPNSTEWILNTIRVLLNHTSNPIIIRQHPAERHGTGAFMTNENYEKLLFENFGNNSQIIFIAAGDPINSYELFEQVKAVVAHTSTIALEATIFGIPVITPSKAYWSDLGFTFKAINSISYKNLLVEATQGKLLLSEEMKKDATLCYYLAQCCNWIFTLFNVEGFDEYSEVSLMEITNLQEVKMMLEAIENNVPYSYIQHRNLMN